MRPIRYWSTLATGDRLERGRATLVIASCLGLAAVVLASLRWDSFSPHQSTHPANPRIAHLADAGRT